MHNNLQQPFSRLDYGIADFLTERGKLQGEAKNRFQALLLKLSAHLSAGHSCIYLEDDELALVSASGLAATQQLTPLILDKNRLYFQRYWQYEQRLARQLADLSQQHFELDAIDSLLQVYFPDQVTIMGSQSHAAKIALTKALTIITGGPGTGKTTTVVKILALLQQVTNKTMVIALAAPTGKAAMRLQQAIASNKAQLPCNLAIKERIPEQVTTIHRLLGSRSPSPFFKHSALSPLPYDVLVVDECSMVDLALMSKLVDALKPGAKLILLGDKNQLASVESGAVLADLTASLPNNTVELQKSYRFQGAIKDLADAVNRQQAGLAWQLLNNKQVEVALLNDQLIHYIVENYLDYLQLIANGADFPDIYAAFNRFKVLCANHQGVYSVQDINKQTEQALAKLNIIQPTQTWYSGRPVMVTSNNPSLQLFNGDIGICLPDYDQQQMLKVFFLATDGRVKKIPPARLVHVETVFAMTIHKSQGSEFDRVLIILPERLNPVLTKELIYTAITRAKEQVRVACLSEVFMASISQKVIRYSGLAEYIQVYQDKIPL